MDFLLGHIWGMHSHVRSRLPRDANLLTQKIRLNFLKSQIFKRKIRFSQKLRLSHLLQGRIVALLLILRNSHPRWRIVQCFCRHCEVYFYMILCHYTSSIEFWGRFLFCFALICWFLMKSRIFKRRYRIIVFPSFYRTKYDKIVLVGISVYPNMAIDIFIFFIFLSWLLHVYRSFKQNFYAISNL